MSAIFGETLTFSQDDGPDVPLVVYGDEFYARYESANGHTVVYDSDRGRYCYALSANGRLTSSGIPLEKPAPSDLPRHLRDSPAVRNKKFRQRYQMMRARTPSDLPIFRTRGPEGGLLSGPRVSEGNVKGLTVLVQFKDVKTNVTKEDVANHLNGDTY